MNLLHFTLISVLEVISSPWNCIQETLDDGVLWVFLPSSSCESVLLVAWRQPQWEYSHVWSWIQFSLDDYGWTFTSQPIIVPEPDECRECVVQELLRFYSGECRGSFCVCEQPRGLWCGIWSGKGKCPRNRAVGSLWPTPQDGRADPGAGIASGAMSRKLETAGLMLHWEALRES